MFDPGSLASRLIVSCQPGPDGPFQGPDAMAMMARAAELGGAAGIRAEGRDDISEIRRAVALPIIGLIKHRDFAGAVHITPRFEDAVAVIEAGADLVAIDATLRTRVSGSSAADLIKLIRAQLNAPVVADVDSLRAGIAADAAGATFVATTLSGYTSGPTPDGPDIALVEALARAVRCPVIAEGRYSTPEHVVAAFAAGAFAVVVGRAITDPVTTTRRLVAAISAAPEAATRRP